jgi:hypothetical protein
MVLERRIEVSYITVAYLGELGWNEMKSKRDFPVEYTWITYVPVWDRAG